MSARAFPHSAVPRAAVALLCAAALVPFLCIRAARAVDDVDVGLSDGGGDAAARTAVSVDAPAAHEIDLVRGEAADRIVYELTLEIPGRKIPLTARLPLETGQTNTTLSLTVQEREGRHASTLSLPPGPDGQPGEFPSLPLGLFAGDPVEVRVVRAADAAAAPAAYRLAIHNAPDGAFALSTDRLEFAEGQTEAAFTLTAARSREENCDLRFEREDDPADHYRMLCPVRRSWLASFENNFYVCFIKKIPFGTREVRETAPDGTVTVRTEQVYKGRWHYITNGLRNTLSVALCAVVLGAILGFLAAIVRYTHDKHGHFVVLDAVAKTYITVIRGTPMTVQLLIAYFIIFSSINNKILVAILAFGFNSGAYVAEIIRAGIVSIDVGQMEAARSLGLSYGQGMRHVVLPQAIRNILPALGNEFIVMLKDTSIASFIGLDDLARGGSIIRSQTYQAYIPFLADACIYLVLVMIFSKLLARLERHLQRSSR